MEEKNVYCPICRSKKHIVNYGAGSFDCEYCNQSFKLFKKMED